MDPAFLVWIPPLEEGDILKEIDENKVPIYEEILPKEPAYQIYTVFWGFATFSLLGLVFMLIMLPETKGKSFASIQAQLKREVARDNAKKLATVEY
ncbi:hypothetical protein EGM85_11525, partial [Macrococcus caseolyticus]